MAFAYAVFWEDERQDSVWVGLLLQCRLTNLLQQLVLSGCVLMCRVGLLLQCFLQQFALSSGMSSELNECFTSRVGVPVTQWGLKQARVDIHRPSGSALLLSQGLEWSDRPQHLKAR